jgi:hypothetical protein
MGSERVPNDGSVLLPRLQYYFNPQGRRFRSRQEVGKAMGLVASKPAVTKEAAAARAAAAAAGLQTPLALQNGIRVER